MIEGRGQSILLRFRRSRALGVLALLLGLAGCGRDNPSLSTETDEPLYREGLQLKREGRTQEALAAYLKLIARRGDQAPDSHLDAGLICLEDIKDPIAAIYHFHKYLELEPNSPNSARVRGLIDTATREFARTLPGRPMDGQVGGGELLDQVDRLQRENDQLRADLAASRAAASAGGLAPRAAASAAAGAAPAAPEADGTAVVLTPVAAEAAPEAAPPPPLVAEPAASPPPKAAPASAARTYTVQPHDSLYRIAKKFYGTASNARVQAILQANRRILPDAAALKPGMELRIP
jgi:LysM repeat protein